MPLTPLSDLLVIKPKPETTLSLESAIPKGAETVRTYRFTPSIRDSFKEMLDLAVSGRGQGYWVQAEYGAGKTHLLATLAILLSGGAPEAWDAVGDEDIRTYKAGLSRTRLFPVILNCKGRIPPDGERPAFHLVLERAFAEALEQAKLKGKVSIGTTDEVLAWWEKAPVGLANDIRGYIANRYRVADPAEIRDQKGPEALSRAILEAADALRVKVPYTEDVRKRFAHIYAQLTRNHGYDGLLVVIDEFKSWQDLHQESSPGHAEYEHVLETLSFHLPVDERSRIITVVGSQSAPPAKLMGGREGDRFRTFSLFAAEKSAREYDEIVAFRVRDLVAPRVGEVDGYYAYYYRTFKFLSAAKVQKDYFRQIFPFQPRCFEVIRNITKRELTTARSSIHYVHDVLANRSLAGRAGLLTVADLLLSETLVSDLQATAYKDAWDSYQSALQVLPQLFDEEEDLGLAHKVLKTLFLWHCAFPDAPRGLVAAELAEACLVAPADDLRPEDLLHGIILKRLSELTQVEYTGKDAGAFFRVRQGKGPVYTDILTRWQRKVDDDRDAAPAWLELLTAPNYNTLGKSMVFAGIAMDRPERVTGRTGKVRYEGERVVVSNWSRTWGQAVLERTDYSLHFRIVYLREPIDIPPTDLQDERIAVVVPARWQDVARDEIRKYCAILRIDAEYANVAGPDAEEIRRSNKEKKGEILVEIKRLQVLAYRNGRVVTKAGLGIRPDHAFADMAKADERIADVLLGHAYRSQPFSTDLFQRELTGAEPGRIFAALFQGSQTSADMAAVENFSRGLGLSSGRKPKAFDPNHCALFDLLRTELQAAGGDLRLYPLFEKLAGPPFGVPPDVLSLTLLAFVRLSDPNGYLKIRAESPLSLRSGQALRDNRLGFGQVPEVTWARGKLHRSLECLVQVEGPGWNDWVDCFRELDATLQATTVQEQVISQQDRLAHALVEWKRRVQGIRDRIRRLAHDLRQDVAEALGHLDAVEAVCDADARTLQTFAEVLEERFSGDRDRFRASVAAVRLLETLDHDHLPAIIDAVRWLDRVQGIPTGDALVARKMTVRAGFDLPSFCRKPEQAANALLEYASFRAEYGTRYVNAWNAYRAGLQALRGRLDTLAPVVAGLSTMDSVTEIGRPTASEIARKHKELLAKTAVDKLPASAPDVRENPVTAGVTLESQVPLGLVADLESDADMAALARLEVLSGSSVKDVLAKNREALLEPLLSALEAQDAGRSAREFTPDVAARVGELLRIARIVVVDLALSDFGPVQVGDDPGGLAKVARDFAAFLERRLADIRRTNPGRVVRLNLK